MTDAATRPAPLDIGELCNRLERALTQAGHRHGVHRLTPMADTGLAHHHVWLTRDGTDWVARLPKQSQLGLDAHANLDYQAACFERASLSGINQVRYVKDFDVEIAQAAAIADPIVDVISDGVILDVRPVVSSDRRFITLELRPTVSQLRRPIPERNVSFGVGNNGRLQLPQLEVQRVRTTVTVPDGGTLLLGGLKIAEERNTKSGVPILSDIPVLSFFFSRRGQFNRYKNLLVLLRARVMIMTEYEPGLEIGR